jgi:hypothetical protein
VVLSKINANLKTCSSYEVLAGRQNGKWPDVMAPFNIRFYPVLRKMDGGEKKCSNKFQIVQEPNSKRFIFFATYE